MFKLLLLLLALLYGEYAYIFRCLYVWMYMLVYSCHSNMHICILQNGKKDKSYLETWAKTFIFNVPVVCHTSKFETFSNFRSEFTSDPKWKVKVWWYTHILLLFMMHETGKYSRKYETVKLRYDNNKLKHTILILM